MIGLETKKKKKKREKFLILSVFIVLRRLLPVALICHVLAGTVVQPYRRVKHNYGGALLMLNPLGVDVTVRPLASDFS